MNLECDVNDIHLTFCDEIHSKQYSFVSTSVSTFHFPVIDIFHFEFVTDSQCELEKPYRSQENNR